jgi:hypothetical protein
MESGSGDVWRIGVWGSGMGSWDFGSEFLVGFGEI